MKKIICPKCRGTGQEKPQSGKYGDKLIGDPPGSVPCEKCKGKWEFDKVWTNCANNQDDNKCNKFVIKLSLSDIIPEGGKLSGSALEDNDKADEICGECENFKLK